MSEETAEPAPSFPCIEFGNLFELARSIERVPWQPFREGVDIHRFYGDGISGPSAALIRFREDATIPRHRHGGYEHIIVLAGQQRDENGCIEAGTLRIHPPGSAHLVTGGKGCLVLAIYEKPVTFLED